MSTCKECGARITWARSADGSRWLRPLEAKYTLVLPDPDEITVAMFEGEWRQMPIKDMRLYKQHACPEDPSDLIGMAKVVTVDEEEEARQEEEERQAEEEYRLSRMERVVSRYKDHQLRVDCPTCYAVPGEPCKIPVPVDEPSTMHYIGTPCRARNLVTAFEDDQPWPPRRNQRGYKAMEMWLWENPTVLMEPGLSLTSI